MVIKECIICGNKFNATNKAITCSEKCSKKNDKIYQEEYRTKNWIKWREYRRNKPEKPGTGDLLEHMHRAKDGSLDFEGEKLLIKREMIRLGIIYHK